MKLKFEDVSAGRQSSAQVVLPISCAPVPDKVCSSNGVETVQLLRASDGEPWGHLEDRGLFDWKGQGVTLGAPGHTSASVRKYLEIADVDLDTAYGPWRECYWDAEAKKERCTHAEPELVRSVGRSSAQHLTGESSATGQCEDNNVVGSWFMLPHEGECGKEDAVGDNGCTWKLKSFKVVE